jgi:phenylalanyl-tRNA synthetase beta chain
MDVPDAESERILRSLGFDVETRPSGWRVAVPGWRPDVGRAVDLIEEIGRHHGFEHLPTTFPAVEQAPPPSDPRIARDDRVRRALLGMGFSEAITFAFIESAAAEPFLEGRPPVALANPLSEKFAVMRPGLVAGLVDAVSHNRRRERRDVRLFEIGTVFSPDGERRAAAFAWTGAATPEHWSGAAREVDFFDASGVVEQVATAIGAAVVLAPIDVPWLVPGRAAEVLADGARAGVVGQVAGDVIERRNLPPGDAVYVAELDLDRLTSVVPPGTRHVTALPRHPSSTRDLSLLLDDTLSAESVRDTIRSAGPDTLVGLREFDRYQGQGIPDGKVSLSIRLIFRAPDRTLTDGEVQEATARILEAVQARLGAVQR